MTKLTLATVRPEEDLSHRSGAQDDEHWQESWALHFFDPIRRVAGYHHIGLQVPRQKADVWSWMSVEGQLAYSYQNLDLPLPQDDYTNIKVGPFQLRSIVPNTVREISVDQGNYRADLRYEAIMDPISFHGDREDGFHQMAAGHYETLGTLRGTAFVDGKPIQIDALAYDDRSWGRRDWRVMTNHRFLWAYFGKDLYMALYSITTAAGSHEFGWVFDSNGLQPVVKVDFEVAISSDGATPRGMIATAWTAGGYAYHLQGRCDGANVVTQAHGFMCAPAGCLFTLGGRVGPGFVEISELKAYNRELGTRLGPNDRHHPL